jgi:hypothetical protein
MRVLLFACLMACTSTSSTQATTAPTTIGCDKLATKDDCFVAFVEKVNACLGGTLSGAMDLDNRACGTETRGVIFHSPATGKAQHFSVMNNGKKCLEWTREEGQQAFIAVSETSTFQLTAAGEEICPDGKKLVIKSDGCTEKVPGATYETAAYVQMQLNGSERPQFRCDFVDGTLGDAATGG